MAPILFRTHGVTVPQHLNWAGITAGTACRGTVDSLAEGCEDCVIQLSPHLHHQRTIGGMSTQIVVLSYIYVDIEQAWQLAWDTRERREVTWPVRRLACVLCSWFGPLRARPRVRRRIRIWQLPAIIATV